jgi:hypothetical protein
MQNRFLADLVQAQGDPVPAAVGFDVDAPLPTGDGAGDGHNGFQGVALRAA